MTFTMKESIPHLSGRESGEQKWSPARFEKKTPFGQGLLAKAQNLVYCVMAPRKSGEMPKLLEL